MPWGSWGGYPARSSWGGYPARSSRGGVPWPRGVPWPGVPCLGGYPCQGGTLARGGTLAGGVPWLQGTQLGQHREYLLHGRRYASCVHAGGLSCWIMTAAGGRPYKVMPTPKDQILFNSIEFFFSEKLKASPVDDFSRGWHPFPQAILDAPLTRICNLGER